MNVAHAFIATLAEAHAKSPGDAAACNPQRKALAYRVRAHCEAVGWDCTIRDLADEFGVTVASIHGLAAMHKSWFGWLRVATRDNGAFAERESFMSQTRLHDLEFAPRAGWVEE